MSVLFFLLVAVGAVNLAVGYLIRYGGVNDLIAGVDPRQLANPARLGRWVGGWGMALGVECWLASLAVAAYPTAVPATLRVFAVSVIVTVTVLAVGSRRRAR